MNMYIILGGSIAIVVAIFTTGFELGKEQVKIKKKSNVMSDVEVNTKMLTISAVAIFILYIISAVLVFNLMFIPPIGVRTENKIDMVRDELKTVARFVSSHKHNYGTGRPVPYTAW